MVPARLNRDMTGPIARTVTDVAKLFQAMVGFDAADNLTSISLQVHRPASDTFVTGPVRGSVQSQCSLYLRSEPSLATMLLSTSNNYGTGLGHALHAVVVHDCCRWLSPPTIRSS